MIGLIVLALIVVVIWCFAFAYPGGIAFFVIHRWRQRRPCPECGDPKTFKLYSPCTYCGRPKERMVCFGGKDDAR